MADVSYVPGALTAVTGDQCWALVEASPDSPAVSRIWQRLGHGTAADALLAGLVADGLDGTAGFTLLVAGTGGRHRLFCHGTVGATVVTGPADGTPPGQGQAVTERIDGAGLLTWREQVVDSAVRIFLGDVPADTALRLPATSGVLLADCVIIDLAKAAAEKPKKTIVFFPDTITMTHPGSPAGHASAASLAVGYPPGERRAAAPAPPTAPFTGPVGPPGPPGPPARPGVSGSGAFPAPAIPARDDADHASPWSGSSRTVADAPQSPVPQPWPPLPAPVPGPPGGLLEEFRARTTPPDRIGPVVPALLCRNGHVNPPGGAVCRRCGAPLPPDPVPVPRPVLGVLRLSFGDVIMLDRGVVMGRNPRTDFAGDGEERPHVVKLPSADGDISRTHLRVTLNGWHVLVTDLNSTNGTLVTLPGREPQQLRPGEPAPIQPGTVVTLADGIDFRYEVTE